MCYSLIFFEGLDIVIREMQIPVFQLVASISSTTDLMSPLLQIIINW